MVRIRYSQREGKDKSIIINGILSRNLCVDNLLKCQLPQTWNHVKEQPNERGLSFLASITNTHISMSVCYRIR